MFRHWLRIPLVIMWGFAGPVVYADEATNGIEKIYDKQCATCHGNNGDGMGRAGASLMPKPTDFTAADYRQSIDETRMLIAIRDGVPGTSMVGYGRRLNDETLQGLVGFIKARFMGMQAAQQAGSPDGQQIYEANCAVCHGDNGNSAVWAKNGLNPPPRNFTTPMAREELTRDRMIASVTHGRPGTAMMSFSRKLNDSEIESVVDYIRSSFMGYVNENVVQKSGAGSLQEKTNQPTDTYKYAGKYEANVIQGEAFYQSNCFNCHGKTGEGNGPRASFNFPRPRNFTTEASRSELTRDKLFQAIAMGKRGTVMPAWKTVLSDQQIADVAEYVYVTFVHPQKKKP